MEDITHRETKMKLYLAYKWLIVMQVCETQGNNESPQTKTHNICEGNPREDI